MARRDSVTSLGPAQKYKMSADCLGICLIFNNKTFRNGKPARPGTDNDKEKLRAIFHSLKFHVFCHDDVSNIDMLDTITRAAQKDHTNYNCFVCCILSHGDKGVVYGSNSEPIKIRKLTERMCPQSCPTLCGKPKVFIIQACQGSSFQGGHPEVQTDAVDAEDKLIPTEADFLVAYSTVPGSVAFRHIREGSYFIQALVETLYRYAHRYDILRILTYVNHKVGCKDFYPENEECPQKQSPAQRHTLRKLLYLSSTPLNARPHPQSDHAVNTVMLDADATNSCPTSSTQQQEEKDDMAVFLKMLDEIKLQDNADTPCGYPAEKPKAVSAEQTRKNRLSPAPPALLQSAEDQIRPRHSSRDARPASDSGFGVSPPHASRDHRPLSNPVSATVSPAGAGALARLTRQQSVPATLPAARKSRATFPDAWNAPKP